MFFFLQQTAVPEPDIQPSYSPVTQQRGWNSEPNREQDADENGNDNDNEQLIENEEGTPKMEPYMRASKAVSMEANFPRFST